MSKLLRCRGEDPAIGIEGHTDDTAVSLRVALTGSLAGLPALAA